MSATNYDCNAFGVRQGKFISPVLYSVYIFDLGIKKSAEAITIGVLKLYLLIQKGLGT